MKHHGKEIAVNNNVQGLYLMPLNFIHTMFWETKLMGCLFLRFNLKGTCFVQLNLKHTHKKHATHASNHLFWIFKARITSRYPLQPKYFHNSSLLYRCTCNEYAQNIKMKYFGNTVIYEGYAYLPFVIDSFGGFSDHVSARLVDHLTSTCSIRLNQS